VLFATAITLFLVPSLYLMLDDCLKLLGLDNAIDPALVEHHPAEEVPTLTTSGGGN
jgi:hypothetical protein